MRKTIKDAFAASGVALCGILLAGCASPSSHVAETSVPVPTAYDLIGDWNSPDFDVEPVTEVDEMTAFSEAGIIGKVAGFTQGELDTNAPEGTPNYSPVLLRIDVSRTVAGELTDPTSKSIYVALPGTLGASEYERSVGAGTPVVVYVNDITSADGLVGMSLRSGAPEGTTIYTVTHPSGLAFELGAGDGPNQRSTASDEAVLVFPYESGVARGVGVDDLVPGEEVPVLVQAP
ncbi:hypothetical protein ACIP5T_02865 [Microbacterium sp. NPDC088619]|uniref:hypothetical protein n=1 Tax=Microbacterium sp. NPDC088619 TaxID=3364196 RepID=UPI003801981D